MQKKEEMTVYKGIIYKNVMRHVLLTSAAIVLPALAWGQAAPTTPARSDGLEEIVVTAQKKAEPADTVGMSINAVSGDQLKVLGVNSVADLTKIEPSFVVARSNLGQPIYSIRGVSFNTAVIGAPPAVGVYVDEVPFTYNAMTKGAPLDLERVEVLKGPQGTLFGQNATAGAINYIAAKPTDYLTYGIEGTYGRFDAANLNGYVSGPLTDTLNARFAFNADQGGAWQRSTTRDDTLGNKDNKQARLLLAWAPIDNLKVVINFNGWTDNSQNQAPQFYALGLTKKSYPSALSNIVNAPLSTEDPQAADWFAGTHPANNEGYYQGSLRADYTIPDAAVITYLATYEHYTQADNDPYSGVDTLADVVVGANVHTMSQELRATGKLLHDDKLEWLLGGDYASTGDHEDTYNRVTGTTSGLALKGLGGTTQGLDADFTLDDQHTSSGAIFGNLEYHILDNLSVHGGARYTSTDIDHSGCTGPVTAIGAAQFTGLESRLRRGVGVVPILPGHCVTFGPTLLPGLVVNSLDQQNASWRFGIDYMPIEKTLIYVTVTKGYKGGTFPDPGATSFVQLAPTVQESVLATEFGFKSRLLDNKLDVEGAVFLYDYTNKQEELKEPDPFGVFGFLTATLNVPKTEELGGELTVKYRPIQQLTLNGSLVYLDSKVTRDFYNFNQFVNVNIDFKGEPLPNTPKWGLTLGAQYDWDLNDSYGAYIGADGRFQSKTQSYFGVASAIAEGFPSEDNASYAILNLRAGVKSNDGHWRFEAFGNNVTNTFYTTQTIRGDAVARYTGMAAAFGLTVGYRY